MYKIVKVSSTRKRGTIEGRQTVLLKEHPTVYRTEKGAKMVLTKLGWEVENKAYKLLNGYVNFVGWIIVKADSIGGY